MSSPSADSASIWKSYNVCCLKMYTQIYYINKIRTYTYYKIFFFKSMLRICITSIRWVFSGLHSSGCSRYNQPSGEILIFSSVSPFTKYEETPSTVDVNWRKTRFENRLLWYFNEYMFTYIVMKNTKMKMFTSWQRIHTLEYKHKRSKYLINGKRHRCSLWYI